MQAESTILPRATELASAGRQVWEAVSGWLGRGRDSLEVTLMFTELSGFPAWVLEAGDERAVELLRDVATVVEPCVTSHQGKVVKRLGHGHMAVFPESSEAVHAALSMQAELSELAPARRLPRPRSAAPPRLRAGLHSGNPRRMDGDYLGADVNIAARIAEAAKAGEVLVSGDVLGSLEEQDRENLEIKRRRAFRAKGTPPDLEVYCVRDGQEG